MPALPYAMADLPAKPITTGYEYDSYHRDVSRRSRNDTSMRWNGTGSTSSASTSSTHPYPHDDRRSRYSARSYNGSSNSSLNSGSTINSSGFNTSTGQPSPSSSTTSTGSSLRTPPDLLLNGATLATSLTSTFSSQKGLTKSFEKSATSTSAPQIIHLSVNQLERRLQLLSELSLSKDGLSSDLPTPPSSPKANTKAKVDGKKRKADYSSDSDNDKKDSKTTSRRRYGDNSDDHSRLDIVTSISSTSSERWRLPNESKRWSKDLYFETAKLYRQRGRELKHRGDNRRRDISTNKRLTSSPEKESLVASLEQLDALLLYMYGFWCEDQACGGSCVMANWTSLYGLLKYVYDQLMKSKMAVLAGLCRLLEAVVRRHVANHEMRLVNHRLSKTVTPNAMSATAAQSPASTTAASPSSFDSTQQTLAEVSEAFTRILADTERSTKLMQQSRLSILNLSVLQELFPLVSQICHGCMKNRTWSSADQMMLAMRIDPSAGLQESSIATAENGWIWPLDINTPFPLIVCFGRAILREAAIEAKVPLTMESIQS